LIKDMLENRLTKLLNIKYPIIQGGMQWLSNADLAAAVSNAGGLGVIVARMYSKPETLRQEIKKIKGMTDKPFGLNISLPREINEDDGISAYFDLAVEEGIPIIETAGNNPEHYISKIKKAGIKLIHKVPSVRYAKKAEEIGADAVTIVGFECGGRPGMDDVTTFILTRKAARELNVPILTGGGVSDGQSLVAALSLGAEGVVIGTRFVASIESIAHPNIKEWIVSAQETDTVRILRTIGRPARVMRNAMAERVAGIEQISSNSKDLLPLIKGNLGKEALLEGDLDNGLIAIGQDIGLIDSIESVEEIISTMVEDAKAIVADLSSLFNLESSGIIKQPNN
jgi:NADH:quinone reductase (non-electrogenic)